MNEDRMPLELDAIYQQTREERRKTLAAARELDGGLAAKRGELRRFGESGRLTRQISTVAVMNAVDTEGREVLTTAAEGYWKDQDRREFGISEGSRSVKVMKNRHGRVSFRKVY